MTNQADFRLTALSHGGGCGCKMPPRLLASLLDGGAAAAAGGEFPALLVSVGQREDAAVWRCEDGGLLVASIDFFTPIVDDARDFGRIAAANALSDIYAMGAQPLFALNVLAMPVDKAPREAIVRVLEGGAAICAEAGVPIVGGHSINLSEPVYGLAVLGRAAPGRILRNSTARAGDALLLGKPLGTGVLAVALKRGVLEAEAYDELIGWAVKLNRVGTELAALPGVRALTDVTGFGLLGHLAEMCAGARLAADLEISQAPFMHAAVAHARKGVASGAARRNLEGLALEGAEQLAPWLLNLLGDPQTSGGLLVACAPAACEEALALFRARGFDRAAAIGNFRSGSGIRLLP